MVQRAGRAIEPLPLMVVRPGRAVVVQGAACAGAWIVESGVLVAEAVDREGRRSILDVPGPGALVGWAAGAAPWTVRARTPARLRPCTAGEAAAAQAVRDARLAALALALGHDELITRVADRLADLADRFGRPVPGGLAIPFALPQEDLAAMTAAARESVNRAVARLVAEDRIAMPRRSRYVVRSQLRVVP